MKKYQIKSVMLTSIGVMRVQLITNEKMVNYCNGKEEAKNSINDDLESFFENIRLGKQPVKYARTYFLPKLTEEELELVDKKDLTYFASFIAARPSFDRIDVVEAEMKASESNSKFVLAKGWRQTSTVENIQIEDSQTSQNCFRSCSLQ